MKRWCVFVSGTGSNLRALFDCKNMNISLVVSQKKWVRGIHQAQAMGVPFLVLPNPILWNELSKTLMNFGITDIFLAGFMKILPEEFILEWKNHIYNIHPSFLPYYPGLKSIEKAYSEKGILGVSIHRVNEILDGGEILMQKKSFRLLDLNSTEISIHTQEHLMMREFARIWG